MTAVNAKELSQRFPLNLYLLILKYTSALNIIKLRFSEINEKKKMKAVHFFQYMNIKTLW